MNSDMSLLDYFAGQALAGYCAAHIDRLAFPVDGQIAIGCYDMAEAMLAERERRRGERLDNCDCDQHGNPDLRWHASDCAGLQRRKK